MFGTMLSIKSNASIRLRSSIRQFCLKLTSKDKNPLSPRMLFVNTWTSGVLMVAGDIIQQEIEYRGQAVKKRYDWSRVGKWQQTCIAETCWIFCCCREDVYCWACFGPNASLFLRIPNQDMARQGYTNCHKEGIGWSTDNVTRLYRHLLLWHGKHGRKNSWTIDEGIEKQVCSSIYGKFTRWLFSKITFYW